MNLKYYQQSVIPYPEIQKVKLTKECEFIVMGCDGIFDCVNIQELCNYIAEQIRHDCPISSIISKIFDQTLAKDSNGN